MDLTRALEIARQSRSQAETDFFQHIAIPSVSTLNAHAGDCRRAAENLVAHFGRIGMASRLIEGDGHPTVLAEWVGAPDRPMLTIYGHYDVQPPDPLELWESPPFVPTVRQGKVFGRGAEDSKGNHFACLKGAEYAFAAGGPPLNLRFLIEGEEEGGGSVLPGFLEREGPTLKTDYVLIDDGGFVVPEHPSLITALRGLVYTEVEVRGPSVDLHSGTFGGNSPNPLNTLAHIIAALKTREGHVNVPGFYDAVKAPSRQELDSWQSLGLGESELLGAIGSSALEGEPDQSVLMRAFARPTLDVHGIMGGFTDEGTKTVIPARASAKISMRLVADQVPATIYASFERFCQQLATPGTQVFVRQIGTPAEPVECGVEHPGARAAAAAFEKVWGVPTQFVRAGGTIPVTVDFQRALGAPLVVTGFGQANAGAHGPNESMDLEHFHRGTEFFLHFMAELARA